jgi:hypothetical protein
MRGKRLHFLLLLLMMMTTIVGSDIEATSGPVTCERAGVNGAAVYVVKIDLNCRDINVAPVVAGKTGKKLRATQSFAQFIASTAPVCAINGTHFDVMTKRPVSTIIIDGKTVSWGLVGSALCIGGDNRIEFKPLSEFRKSKYRHVICAGPTLLRKGAVWLNPRAERYRDPRIYGYARRSAVGLTGHNKLLLVTTCGEVTLRKLAGIMRAMGCTDALAMDGGSSSALYYRGRYLTRPSRRLTNILAVSLKTSESGLADSGRK